MGPNFQLNFESMHFRTFGARAATRGCCSPSQSVLLPETAMTTHFEAAAWEAFRLLAGDTASTYAEDTYHNTTGSDAAHGAEESHSSFGVHITYEELYDTLLFLVAIYVAGQVACRVLRMPNLVGEIVAGILLGPPLADFVPNPEAWVLLGEIGLILLVVEAGIDIDVSTLKLIGTRGCLIAIVGSILPIGIGIALALALNGTQDVKAAIAAGASFGPTSLGIALNILRSGGVLNTPVGQMIVSAAVIDDMIALIILSQLEALVGNITVVGVVIPIVSALLFLIIGGYVALYVLPPLLDKYVIKRVDEEHKGKLELAIMFAIVLAMMPATHYAKASYLMGAFVSGLAFCTSHELHHTFLRQLKRVLQWLMRIFFSASIGFQVPVTSFGDATVVWQGLVFTAALLGKLAVGFMVPNFTQSARFTGYHLKDCLVTGFSMAAEGEFAFVIAVFAVDSGLINTELYASVVLAVLLSSIIPPFLLRFTIGYYNRKAQADVDRLAKEEMERNHDLERDTEMSDEDRQAQLVGDIRSKTAVFLCIQTRSMSRWGLLNQMMSALASLGLDIIDHRSWHPRGISTTLVTEVYVKDKIEVKKGESQEVLNKRIAEIREALEKKINQPDEARVNVQRWYPGVVQEIVESYDEKSKRVGSKKLNVEERLLMEAEAKLTAKQTLQQQATTEKSVQEILASMNTQPTLPSDMEEGAVAVATGDADAAPAKARRARRRRQKMRSTPVVGGGLFGETDTDSESSVGAEDVAGDLERTRKAMKQMKMDFNLPRSGHKAELIVDGESYNIRISSETLKALRKGFSGDMLDSRGLSSMHGISIEPDEAQVVNRLQGYIRNMPLNKIVEEPAAESESETSSLHGDASKNGGPK